MSKIDSAEATRICSAVPSGEGRSDQGRVATMPIGMLLSSDSPRLAGVNSKHARALAESEATLPPIIVNRATLRVIDGMHRLRAAALRDQKEIEIRFFDGDERDAFVLAVETNIAHGLPLSLAERTAAAARIITSHPEWSDRMIASKAGLAAQTVGAIRRRSTEGNPQLNARIGRDGRLRPLSTAEGRAIATRLMNDRPHAPLREIASAAGISLGTAQDVRKRLRQGHDSIATTQQDAEQRTDLSTDDKPSSRHAGRTARGSSVQDRTLLLKNLRSDPSLSFTDTGRVLLRLLYILAIGPQEWDQLINNIPVHCRPMIRHAAHACANTWHEFAEQLDEH